MTKRLQVYETEGITVTFDPDICTHSGVCIRGLPDVFDVRRKDWVRPYAGSIEVVAAQVARCPSGALQSFLTASLPPVSESSNSPPSNAEP